MIPDTPAARAGRFILAFAVLVNPSISWSQRIAEVPVATLSGPAGSGAKLGSPTFQVQVAGPGGPGALTSVALHAARVVGRGTIGLPATALPGVRGAGLASGLKGPFSTRAQAPAGAQVRETASTLGTLAAGAEQVARAMRTDGVIENLGATGRVFGEGFERPRALSGTGSDDSASHGAGGVGAPAGNGNGSPSLPRKLAVIRMEKPLFPGTRTRFIPGNPMSTEVVAAAAAGENGRHILVATGRADGKGLFPVASVVRVVDYSTNGTRDSAMFEVVAEAVIDSIEQDPRGQAVATVHYQGRAPSDAKEARGLLKAVKDTVRELMPMDVEADKRLMGAVLDVDDPENVAVVLGSEMPFPVEVKQNILAARSTVDRLRVVARALVDLKTEGQVAARAKKTMGTQQREYVLRQKLKAIQQELGEGDEGANEVEEFAAKVEASGMPEEVKAKARSEIKKLKTTNPQSAEYTVGRNYVDWLVSLPWGIRTENRIDLKKARAVLDEDHNGLEEVKEMVLEFLAVRLQTGNKKGAIIVFDGPPGTGKTSIGKAIALAMGRKYIRWSVGGVSNEAEVRGHRRTYIGAMPGQPIQKIRGAGSVNPVFVVDEGDKIGAANATGGDPQSALLELFDPEQNSTFHDHYLDVDFDFSETIFVVTSNELMLLPEALRHRMELVEFSAYTDNEKLGIVERHLLDKNRKKTGLSAEQIGFSPEAILKLIRGYTHEAGVREIDRMLNKVMRKVVARMRIQGEPAPGTLQADQLETYIGKPRYDERRKAANGVGTGTGLSVSGYGGGILTMEATATPGDGRFTLRKQMLEMTDDSAHNVETFVKSVAHRYGITPKWFQTHNVDFNFFPAGKVDGPSAGVLMATTLVSEATGRKIKDGIAMTGEISSKGLVGAIGGLKEKVLAAHRMGYHTVLFPAANIKDLEKIPADIQAQIKLIGVSRAEEVFALALEDAPARPAPSAWERFIGLLARMTG